MNISVFFVFVFFFYLVWQLKYLKPIIIITIYSYLVKISMLLVFSFFVRARDEWMYKCCIKYEKHQKELCLGQIT